MSCWFDVSCLCLVRVSAAICLSEAKAEHCSAGAACGNELARCATFPVLGLQQTGQKWELEEHF